MDGAEAADQLRRQLQLVKGRSPLYERLLAGLAGAADRGFDGGVVARVLTARSPVSETRLLLLAALHDAALRDPDLPHAAWFATAVDAPRPASEGAPGALALAYLVEHEDDVAEFVAANRLQTNEIGRCSGLLPGFLTAAGYSLPLRLLEVGCSAGLNLRFDRYRYEYLGGPHWGPTRGPRLEATAEGAVPTALVPPTIEIAERRGVDVHPIDPTTPEGARLLTSFVWPDEKDRHRRLQDAIEVARATPATLDAGDLVPWTADHLHPRSGTVTVLFHSLVSHLLDDATAAKFDAAVERGLRAGTADAPVVYLRLEPPHGLETEPELVVVTGDGSGPPRRTTIVTADAHGRWVRWW